MKRSSISGFCAAIFTMLLFIVGKIELGGSCMEWMEMLELFLIIAGFLAYAVSILLRKDNRKDAAYVALAGLLLTGFSGFFTMLTFIVIIGCNLLVNNKKTVDEIDKFCEEE